MTFTEKIFDSSTVKMLTGIQVSDEFNYELVLMSFDDFNIKQQEHLKECFTEFTQNDFYIECMVNRLKLGGSLLAITITEDRMLADGCHRTYAYMVNETKEFYALIKRQKI